MSAHRLASARAPSQSVEPGIWEPSVAASAAVEVGDGRGALILYTPPSLLGLEIEVQPLDGPPSRTHTSVRERQLPDGGVAAALFGSLPAGRYRLTERTDVVEVASGSVTEYHLLS
jgi:hypothetical protein